MTRRKQLATLAYRVDRTLSKGMDHGLSDDELEPLRAQKRQIEAALRDMRTANKSEVKE